MGKRKKQQQPAPAPQGPATTSLGGLLAGLGFEATSEPEAPASDPPAAPDGLDLATQPKLVLRMERKGRGGKTVTLIEKLRADDAGRAALAKRVAKALGTGCRVEGEVLVVQGDVRERLGTWLRAQGVRKVVG